MAETTVSPCDFRLALSHLYGSVFCVCVWRLRAVPFTFGLLAWALNPLASVGLLSLRLWPLSFLTAPLFTTASVLQRIGALWPFAPLIAAAHNLARVALFEWAPPTAAALCLARAAAALFALAARARR